MGHLYQRGPVWWIQFYQDGQRVRMTSESTDKDVAKRLLKEHEARDEFSCLPCTVDPRPEGALLHEGATTPRGPKGK